MQPVLSASDCCNPCEAPTTTSIPGPAGEDGSGGDAGGDGLNAFTLTTDSFIMPAIGEEVVIDVADSSWMVGDGGAVPGETVYVGFAGYMEVMNLPSATTARVRNNGAAENATGGAVIPSSSGVTPSGVAGADGLDGADGTNGTNGINAYTVTTADFAMPAASSTVDVTVAEYAWMVVGQMLWVLGAGYMEVVSFPGVNQVRLENVGYPENVAAATVISSGAGVSPAGSRGATGATGSVSFANPTGLIGLTVVNGVSTDSTRSDATHALDQAIAPTWTAKHIFSVTPNITPLAGNASYYKLVMGGVIGNLEAPSNIEYAVSGGGLIITTETNGTSLSASKSLTLIAGTAATLGNPQWSPGLRQDARAWRTSDSTSRTLTVYTYAWAEGGAAEIDGGWGVATNTPSATGFFPLHVSMLGNVLINRFQTLATNATDGFLYLSSCAGIPTGTPTAYGSTVPVVFDTTNFKLYAYMGGAWKSVTLT